jgi:flagella basal body P-ring formation protein FlgA
MPPPPSAKSVTLLCAAALWAGQTLAVDLPPETVAQALALARSGAQTLAPAGARIEAVAGPLDSRLRLAPCARIQPYLPAGASPWGKTRVALRCLEGAVAWQVQLPVTVHVWAPAAVPAAPLPAGARLEGTELQVLESDWAAAPGKPFASVDELIGRVLVRPLAAGSPLRATDLRPRQWFAQGDTVQILARGRGFAISAEGQALAPGLEGHPVRVRTEAGRVVTALPVARGRVELSL